MMTQKFAREHRARDRCPFVVEHERRGSARNDSVNSIR